MREFINIVTENLTEPTITDLGDGGYEFNGFDVHAELGGNEIGSFTSNNDGLGNGKKAVAWLKNYFGELSVYDPGFPNENPDSFAFWKRMAEHGLVDQINAVNGFPIYKDGKWNLNWEDPETVELYGPGFPELSKITERANPEWKKSPAASQDAVVWVDVELVNQSASKDHNFYVGPKGEGGISGRYDRFDKWMGQGEAVEMPEITLTDSEEISFINGRHRFAWMRDQGIRELPVAVSGGVADAVERKYGSRVIR